MELQNTLIICTKDRIIDLKLTMVSVINQTKTYDEIIIVDSSKNTETENYINCINKKYNLKIKYFKSEPGLTLQRNIGIGKASGNIIHFLDDDVDLDSNYLLNMSNIYENDNNKEIAGIGGKLTNISSNFINKIFRTIFFLPRSNGKGCIQMSGFPAFQWLSNNNEIKETKILCGLCSYRKEVFEEFKYDEAFLGYGFMEDVDFSYSVSKKFKLIYSPLSLVFHRESKASRLGLTKLKKMYFRNHKYVFKKHIPQNIMTIFIFWLSNIGLLFLFLKTYIIQILKNYFNNNEI